LKVPDVARHEREIAREHDRCDSQVRLRETSAFPFQLRPKTPVDLGGGAIEGKNRQSRQNEVADAFDELAAAFLAAP
jgi:hypothetical protein